MTDDLISRADAIAYPLSWEHYDKEHGSRKFISGVESYREYIEHLPSAQPKQGEWKIEETESVWGKGYMLTCSVCGDVFRVTENALPYEKYCRNCGARMEVEHEDD